MGECASMVFMTVQTQSNMTPMMAQYMDIKKQYADSLLFYRMGDFYELFFDDAYIASETLDIALTKRGKANGQDIPMCGVPVHAGESYLERLIKGGYRVAICEQTESPEDAKKRGAKSVVRREVVRVVTPGTITEDSLLNARENNYLASVAWTQGKYAVAYADMSTGEFCVSDATAQNLDAVLSRIAPKELLISEKLQHDTDLYEIWVPYQNYITPIVNSRFDIKNMEKALCDFYGVSVLDGFGDFQPRHIMASGVLLDYITTTQVAHVPHLNPLMMLSHDAYMEIDAVTRASLELTQSLQGGKKQTVLDSIDMTQTGAGGRLLSQWVSSPLTDIRAINKRLDAIESTHTKRDVRDDIVAILKHIPDAQRSLNRLVLGRGVPRDINTIKTALSYTGKMKMCLHEVSTDIFQACIHDLGVHDVLVEKITRAMETEPSHQIRDGGVIRAGYHAGLDKARELRDETRRIISGLESRYRKETGIDSLKIKHNNVLQYFIEITSRNNDKIPLETFIHRQTMKGAMRYTTEELAELSKEILNAKDRALAFELEIFHDLVDDIVAQAEAIAKVAHAYAMVDALVGLSVLASQENWVRPVLNDSLDFCVKGGRHPVVEKSLNTSDSTGFIANDCHLNQDEKIWLLTGPNMAGKSTFLRQNAVIAILAHMGAFVPADACTIGVIDRVFSRVGAQDELARGRSTFMVEMVETATILNQATNRSLVVLDEIGRGTATYDGVSIAWAAVEHLANVNTCRGLFATHYHELNKICDTIHTVKPYTMAVKEWDGDVIFLHAVISGSAKGSYGVCVAKMAGLPPAVVQRAEQVLRTLEQGDKNDALQTLPLFENGGGTPPVPSAVETHLASVDVDSLSPRDALDVLYHLKSIQK